MEGNVEFATKPKEGQAWDIAIIGSGPAGLTAAIYTTRGAASTIILGGEKWGGQLMLTTEVDNYPGLPATQGPEIMNKMRDHATSFGAEFVEKNVDAVDLGKIPFELITKGTKYLARSVIVATGANTRWLGVPGEDKLRGRGVSSCAPCDAPFFKDKKVIVVGGGDSAMEEAMVLTKYATEVTILHRKDAFRASAAMQQKVFEKQKAASPEGKIKILWNTEVIEFIGKQKLEKVKIKSNKDNTESELVVDGAFVAIGHVPATKIFQGQVELDEKGYIKKFAKNGFQMAASVEGVFVAGDVYDYHYRQAVTATGFGCMAAMEALKYLSELKA
jgi:thioredoxin reductase (NADPH)